MSDEVLVKVEGVSKKFCRTLKRSLWYGVQDVTREILGRSGDLEELRPGEFWSVKDVSFELRRGECLGLIGPNGAGKSTLLKMLNGLIKPDRGKVTMRGRVGALIELGAGFNPILTGRENIYVNGAVLGFTTREIDQKLEAIIDFAELEEFIDTPVQNYSSGMRVRLGFAIAAQMEPDVLIIDEVLAVGDAGFRAKCFNAVYGIMNNAAVILVTHYIPQISRICSNLVVLDHGKMTYRGSDIASGLGIYFNCFRSGGLPMVFDGNGKAVVHQIALRNSGKTNIAEVAFGEDLSVFIELSITNKIKHPNIILTIATQDLMEIMQCSSFHNDFDIINTGNKIYLEVDLGKTLLTTGAYHVGLTITDKNHGEVIYKSQNAYQFMVKGKFISHSPIQLVGNWRQA